MNINILLADPIFKRGFDVGFSYRLIYDEFSEELHPRDEKGQFTDGSGGGIVDRPLIKSEKIEKAAKPMIKTAKKAYKEMGLKLFSKQDNGKPISEIAWKELGYDGKPQVVDDETFEEISKDSPVFYRGISAYGDQNANEMANAFKYGKNYAGDGCYGSGTYASQDKNIAADYAKGKNGGAVLEMCLSKDAKVADYKEIETECRAFRRAMTEKGKGDSMKSMMLGDPSIYAAVKGYDAVQMHDYSGNVNHTIILNRTKVIVRK